MARHQRFSIEGVVVEADGGETGQGNPTEVYFGGLEGVGATIALETRRGVFEGDEVADQTFQEMVFVFGGADNLPVAAVTTAQIAGHVHVMYIVN
jgi:hypothetical protein